MNDEFDSILSGSLRDRAAHADTAGRGFGDVRRRVRRRRQRHIAVGMLPGLAGIGWLASRPVASDPLTPASADTTACIPIGVATTAPPPVNLVATTHPEVDANGVPIPIMPTTTSIVELDANGFPLSTHFGGDMPQGATEWDANGNVVTATSIDANGNVVEITALYDPQRDGTTTTWPLDANGLPATTIPPAFDGVVVGDESLAEGYCNPVDSSDTTVPTTAVPTDFSRVLIVDAGKVDIVYAVSLFPGSAAATTGVMSDQSLVYVLNGSDAGAGASSLAVYVAETLSTHFGGDMPQGATEWDANHIYEHYGLTGVDLSQYDVVAVLSRDID